MKLTISGKTLNEITKLYELHTQKFEFEFRIGRYENNKFIPGVTRTVFESVLKTLKHSKSKYSSEESTVILYKNGYREVRSISGVVIQRKKLVASNVETDYGRFSLSEEQIVAYLPPDSVQAGVRKRKRYSFGMSNSVTLDMTHVRTDNKYDSYEIEIEYIPGLDIKTLFEPIKYVLSIYNTDYQGIVKDYESLFKRKGVNFNNAYNMKRKYFPDLKDFIITPKWDGVRMMIYVHQSGIYLLNKTTTLSLKMTFPNDLVNTVIDGEYFESTNKYIAFDILFFKGTDLRDEIRIKRQYILEQTKSDYNLQFEIAQVGYGPTLYECFKNYTTKYPDNVLDGIVFAQRTSTYINKQTLKYKPINLLTIDFLITIDNNDTYPVYKLYVQGESGVIPFEPYPILMKVDTNGKSIISSGNKIVECQWVNDTFLPMRVRTDKTIPNFITVAMDIWEDINNPITETEMGLIISEISKQYVYPRPYRGIPLTLFGQEFVGTPVDSDNSLKSACLFSNDTKFQLMKLNEKQPLLQKYTDSIKEISETLTVSIIVVDMYGSDIINSSKVDSPNSIIIGYSAGPVYVSLGKVVTDGPCKITQRLFNISPTELEVSLHYDTLPTVSREDAQSFNIRKFNNWIKAVLITTTTKQNDKVLDLGSGKGGDLPKWCKQRVSLLTCVDISKQSLDEARRRFANITWCKIKAEFIQANPYTNEFITGTLYDVVSSQYSFHYAFDTSEHIITAVNNINDNLKHGGKFICTVPNSHKIVELRNKHGQSFWNKYYKIKFTSDNSYLFSLSDCINNCEEYLIDIDQLTAIFKDLGISRQGMYTGTQFFNMHKNKFNYLLEKMEVNPALTEEEVEVVDLYNVLIFYKK